VTVEAREEEQSHCHEAHPIQQPGRCSSCSRYPFAEDVCAECARHLTEAFVIPGSRDVLTCSAQAATLLELLVSFTDCFFRRWFCVVLGPKHLLHRHSLLSFGKFQDTERLFIPCLRHVSSRLSPSGESCKYVMAPITQTNLERFSTCWYVSFFCVSLVCCAAEFGISGGTYEFPCSYQYWHEYLNYVNIIFISFDLES
jgi:hypothetical protein